MGVSVVHQVVVVVAVIVEHRRRLHPTHRPVLLDHLVHVLIQHLPQVDQGKYQILLRLPIMMFFFTFSFVLLIIILSSSSCALDHDLEVDHDVVHRQLHVQQQQTIQNHPSTDSLSFSFEYRTK